MVEEVGGLFPLGDAESLARELVRKAPADQAGMEKRLLQCFSDDAARAAFRALPLLRAWQINA
ncbi:hypothetical protein D3C80_1944270 [compost metagenome]